jgi:peptidyl-prolyl cis-trans isomerase B (cyclophilin B)
MRIRRRSEEGKGRPSNKALYCKQDGNQDDGAGTTEEEGSYSAAVSVPPGINRRSAAIKVSTSVASALLLAKNDNCGGVFQAREAKALELSDEDLEITNRVYFDVGLCDSATKSDRTLGARNIFCTEPEHLGRIELGLYGKLVPETVAKFVQAVEAGAFNQTVVQKVFKGEYVLAGKPGPTKYGEVEMPESIGVTNSDLVSPKAFKMKHIRPGTVSLYLQDEASNSRQEDLNRANLEFAITTGPGPAPILDDESVVFGTVTKGFNVILEIANVPTFQPGGNLKAFNKVAGLIGDGRAKNARSIWGKPRRAILFTDTGQILPEIETETPAPAPGLEQA